MKPTKGLRDPKFEPEKINDLNIRFEVTGHVIHCFTQCDHCKNDVHKATKCKVGDGFKWFCDYCILCLRSLNDL
jgi:hypothetical protein